MKKKMGAAIALAAASAVIPQGANPAGASPLRGSSTNTGPFNDFYYSGHDLCVPGGGCVSAGGMVVAWQRILRADGFLTDCGSTGIDGQYGNITAFANGGWENARGGGTVGSADGKVDTPTWQRASYYFGGRIAIGDTGRYIYNGTSADAYFRKSGYDYKNEHFGNLYTTDHPSTGGYPFC